MTAGEIISWVVSPIAILAFVAAFSFLLFNLHKNELLLTEKGFRDDILLDAREKEKNKSKAGKIAVRTVEWTVAAVVFLFVFFGIYTAAFSNDFPLFGSQLKVIGSDSMATVHKSNTYIKANNLTNQFAFDDVVILKDLPKEEDLKVYDVVTYKTKDSKTVIIHRIIEIKETNEGVKLYILRGDANNSSDAAITYDDMRALYSGKRMRGFGALIRFVQSGLGIIAIVVSAFIFVFQEVLDKRIRDGDLRRLAILDGVPVPESKGAGGEPLESEPVKQEPPIESTGAALSEPEFEQEKPERPKPKRQKAAKQKPQENPDPEIEP